MSRKTEKAGGRLAGGYYAIRVRLSRPLRIRRGRDFVRLAAGYHVLFGRSSNLLAEIPERMAPGAGRSFWEQVARRGDEVRACVFPWRSIREGIVCAWAAEIARSMGGERPVPGAGGPGGPRGNECGCPGHLVYFRQWRGGDVPAPPKSGRYSPLRRSRQR
ncbi:MAG: hypothetical protein A2V83_05720 [Nitrospirae bacterium RBG_16_64_22]|nr:MAG: hypothetical protein A2V83_05720 [Nitrospirae bacterium RBG_16_64_22]